MTKKTVDLSSGTPQKAKGWYSWRHRTNDANTQARERYQQEHGRRARQRKAAERLALCDCSDT
jgi:hypothetical protein